MSRTHDLIKNTGILMIGRISTQFVSFLLLPLYTYKLTTESYGTVDLYTTFASILIPILTLQIEQAVFRMMLTNDRDRKELITVLFVFLTISSVLYIVLFIPISCLLLIEDAAVIYTYYITYLWFTALLQIPRGLENNTIYAFASFVSSTVVIVVNVILIGFLNLGGSAILLSNTIGHTVSIVFILARLHLLNLFNLKYFSGKCLQDMLGYSVPLIFNQVSSWIINYSDRIIITIFLGVSFNGIYAIANNFFQMLISFFNIYNMAWTESATKTLHDSDRNGFMNRIINLTIQIYFCVASWIIILVGIVFHYFIGINYASAYYLVPVLIYAAVFSGLAANIGSIFISQKRTGAIAWTTMLAAIINLITHVLLVNKINLYAASLSTFVSFACLFIYRLIAVQKIQRVKIDFGMFSFSAPLMICAIVGYCANVFSWKIVSLIAALFITTIIVVKNKHIITEIHREGVKLNYIFSPVTCIEDHSYFICSASYSKRRIVLIGSFNGFNAGDTMVLASVLKDVDENLSDSTIIVPGLNDNVEKILMQDGRNINKLSTSIRNHALRFFSMNLILEMIMADAVFMTAGTIFARKFVNYKYSFLGTFLPSYVISKFFNFDLKLICYNTGIALDGNKITNYIVKTFVEHADVVSIRHSEDKKILNHCHGLILVSSDNLFSFHLPVKSDGYKSNYIGINISAYLVGDNCIDWRRFVINIIETVHSSFPNKDLLIIVSTKGDKDFINIILEQISLPIKGVIDLTEKSYDEIADLYKEMSLFIGMRMHSLIFAMLQSIPVIGIIYDRKVFKLFDDFNIAELAIPVDALSTKNLSNALSYIQENYFAYQEQIYAACMSKYKLVKYNNALIWKGL